MPAPLQEIQADDPPRVSRRALLRFLVLPLLVVAAFLAVRFTPLSQHLTEAQLTADLAHVRALWWAPLLLIAAYLGFSPVGMPATPLMFAGGVVFGPVFGSIYNLLGVYLAGLLTFLLGRFLGRDFVVRLAGAKLKKIERAIGRRGFWGLVALRFLPLPYPIVNYSLALAGVPLPMFVTTTVIGVTPAIVLYTYFFSTLAHATSGDRKALIVKLTVGLVCLAALTVIPQVIAARKRKARYVELKAARRGRRAFPV